MTATDTQRPNTPGALSRANQRREAKGARK